MENARNALVIMALAALLAGGPLTCSKKEGIGERTGRSLDEAAEEIKEGAEEAGEAIGEGAEEVKEAVEEAVEDTDD